MKELVHERPHSRRARVLNRSSVLVVLLLALAASVYFSVFEGGPTSQEQFGQFGDFIGGVLNPIIALMALFALIEGISVQEEELKATRAELKEARTTAQRQAIHLEEEAQLSDLSRASALLGESLRAKIEVETVLETYVQIGVNPSQPGIRRGAFRASLKELCYWCLAFVESRPEVTTLNDPSVAQKHGQHLAARSSHELSLETRQLCREVADMLSALATTLCDYESIRPSSTLPLAYRTHFRDIARALHHAGLLDEKSCGILSKSTPSEASK